MQTATIPNLAAGETGYETAGGNYFAASYRPHDPRVGYLCVMMLTRIVDASGVPIKNAEGNPIEIDHKFSIRGDTITATHTLADEQQEWLLTAEMFIDHEIAAQGHLAALLA